MPTKVEWCRNKDGTMGETWNYITGCDPDDGHQSEACQNCYARRMAKRLKGRFGYREDHPFYVTVHEGKLLLPFKWKKPRQVFVSSMGDLFHANSLDEWTHIRDVFSVMASNPQHTFMILTKRPGNAKGLLCDSSFVDSVQHDFWQFCQDYEGIIHDFEWPLPNVWLGVTAENQKRADERIPVLLSIPAAKYFVSVEPMLGSVDLFDVDGNIAMGMQELNPRETRYPAEAIDWVIVGAETGPRKRPMDLAWARQLRDDCLEVGVSFFFKKDSDGNRALDGKLWEQIPT